ncbi:U-box domain-containing protein 4-like [Tripterygium wilfordii]|uniref:U-box domain-containing protein 4-like n=1 Tax=Tripterygium wilfordii TaxID=458696 RepID=A0A7J7D2P5_TRIWF|nr:U-box domain-containing protein 4-like [Tripterygium wilfordii]
MKPLVELMADFGSNMVDKSASVLSVLVTVPEARTALVEEGGIPILVEIIEVGSQRQKEIAVVILLQICEESVVYHSMVAREGAIPPWVALSQTGTSRAKQKVSNRLLAWFADVAKGRDSNRASKTTPVL